MPKVKTISDKCTPEECTLIQWEKTYVDKNSNPVCPQCDAPAEMVLGIVDNPCWAHKVVKRSKGVASSHRNSKRSKTRF